MNKQDCILFSGGAKGSEAAFGAIAEEHGIEEVNFSFEGHSIERQRGLRVLNHEELLRGDVSLEYVSRLMNRRYTETPTLRKLLQSIWYQVNSGQEIYVIGEILEDQTDWEKNAENNLPIISHSHFSGSGTRFLEDNGRNAISELFRRSFS